MNIENIKAYLRVALRASHSKGELRSFSCMVWVFSVAICAGGLNLESWGYYLGIAVFVLSVLLVLFSFIITCKLTLRRRLIHNGIFFTVSTIIFDIGCFIFFEYAGLSRPLNILVCWIPVIVAIVSVVVINHKTQKGKFTQKTSTLLTIVAGTVGGGVSAGRIIRVPDVESNSEKEAYMVLSVLLCLMACMFAVGTTNWLTLYYLKTLKARGFEIKDGDLI